jgi:hypothetical protein
MSDPHGIIALYRKGGSMSTIELFDKVINTIYEDNFGHLDFMDNMGGDCDCIIHNVLNYLHEYEVA